MRFRSPAYPLDPLLTLAWAALAACSLVLLYSLSLAQPELQHLPWRQGFHLALALLVQWGVARLPKSRLMALAPLAYGLSLGALLLVPLAGVEVNGARRWLALGPLGAVQPSEFTKWTLLLFQVRCLEQGRWQRALVAALPPALLVLKQPDLGTAACYAVGTWAGFFFAGARWPALLGFPLLLLAGLSQSLHGYQKERLLIFLDPERDPSGSGWNLIQAKIAVGSGGLWGQGWFAGLQKTLAFVPEQHTDFIFTVLAEEAGLAGATLLLLSYAVLLARALRFAAAAPLLCGSATTLMAFQICVNLGMVVGLLPVTGIPLPFLSYGGSAVVTQAALLGLLQGEARRLQARARLQPRQGWSPRQR